MERRDFIEKAGVATTGIMLCGGIFNEVYASNAAKPYDLAAMVGGEPEDMFDKGMRAMGGIEKYVKKGQTVVVKPNIGWDRAPELAANTNPKLVKRVIQACYEAGAKKVYVFDYTCHEWKRCYKNSGIEKAAKEAGATVAPGNDEAYYQAVNIPNGKILKKNKVHELIMECDVFIDVPIIKHHSGAQVTLGLKNMMGIVWDRRFYHRNNLHQCIADFATFRRPDLTVIDGYYIMTKNGPQGVSVNDVKTMKVQVISADVVTADAAATKFFGRAPKEIGHIRIAHEMKLGNMDLAALNIYRAKI